MIKARLTSKGQATIPVRVRRWLGVQQGDDLLFELEEGAVRVRALKRKRLSDLYGALPATRPFPGVEAIRRDVGEDLGRQMLEKDT